MAEANVEIEKPVKFKCGDGGIGEMESKAAKLSNLVNNLLQDCQGDDVVPLKKVTTNALKKIIEYCNQHKDDASASEEDDKLENIGEWDKKFMETNQAMLVELTLAANYMQIDGLLALCAKTLANMMKGKSPEAIRETFGIENDFTKEEEDQIKKQNAWCEEN